MNIFDHEMCWLEKQEGMGHFPKKKFAFENHFSLFTHRKPQRKRGALKSDNRKHWQRRCMCVHYGTMTIVSISTHLIVCRVKILDVVKLCYAFDVKSHTMHCNRRRFYCIGTIGSFQHYDCCQASQRTRKARRNESSGWDFVLHLKLPVRTHCQRGKSCFFLNMFQAI